MREEFRQGAEYVCQIADQIPDDGWESAALGVWTVRDLVGHASRAITNVERYYAHTGKEVRAYGAGHGHFSASFINDLD